MQEDISNKHILALSYSQAGTSNLILKIYQLVKLSDHYQESWNETNNTKCDQVGRFYLSSFRQFFLRN